MGRRWTAPDGWDIELIRLNGSPIYRVRHNKALIVYARTVDDLIRVLGEHGLDVADLVEVDEPN